MIKVGSLTDEKPVTVVKDDVSFIENTRNIQQPHTQELQEPNNIREVIDNLDRDVIDKDSNLTSIDFNTRLYGSEIGSIVALQMLNTLKVGGSACSLIARSIKRHKVSMRGLGREEKVRIIQGEREHETKNSDTSLFGKFKGFMGKEENGKN